MAVWQCTPWGARNAASPWPFGELKHSNEPGVTLVPLALRLKRAGFFGWSDWWRWELESRGHSAGCRMHVPFYSSLQVFLQECPGVSIFYLDPAFVSFVGSVQT